MAPRKTTAPKPTRVKPSSKPLGTKPTSSAGKPKPAAARAKPTAVRAKLTAKAKPTAVRAKRAAGKPKVTAKAKRAAGKPKATAAKAKAKSAAAKDTERNVHFKLAHALEPERQKYKHLRPAIMSPLDSVTLKVDATQRIGRLKQFLRPLLWIPFYEDFMLKKQSGSVFLDDWSLDDYGVKDQDTLLVVMHGFCLHPKLYLRMLDERGDASFPLGGGPGEQLPDGEPEKLKVHFKLENGLSPAGGGPGPSSYCLLVSQNLPIGLLKIMLRSRFWIPFYQPLHVKQQCGRILNNDELTLEHYGINDWDVLLVCINTNIDPGDRKMQIFVKAAHYLDEPWRYPERSKDGRYIVRMTVSPATTINDLKEHLKLSHWIPRENLVLFSITNDPSTSVDRVITVLKDNTSTLTMSGINDGDTLMACMDSGSYQVNVLDYGKVRSFRFSVCSCFQTIGEVKKIINAIKGYPLEDLILTSRQDNVPLGDGTPLVVLGIVKPFLEEMDMDGEYDLMLMKPRFRKPKLVELE